MASLSLKEEEKLSEIVKNYPCLYDKTSRGYKEKDVGINAWNEVAENLDFIEDGKILSCYAYILFLMPNS